MCDHLKEALYSWQSNVINTEARMSLGKPFLQRNIRNSFSGFLVRSLIRVESIRWPDQGRARTGNAHRSI